MKSHEPLAEPDRMRLLAEKAKLYRPRPFTIYGLYDSSPHEFLGWGLHFERLNTAFYYNPESRQSHLANDPAQVYCLYSKMADACMEWLDH